MGGESVYKRHLFSRPSRMLLVLGVFSCTIIGLSLTLLLDPEVGPRTYTKISESLNTW